jgi:hypothetical protein
LSTLERAGRGVQRDGQAVTDPAEASSIIGDAVRAALDHRVVTFARSGILDDWNVAR